MTGCSIEQLSLPNKELHSDTAHHEPANCAALTVPQAPNYQAADRTKVLLIVT